MSNPSLDIVTGFQVMDGNMHMYVLEGLIDQAIHLLWEALPQPENEGMLNLPLSNHLVPHQSRTFTGHVKVIISFLISLVPLLDM